MSVIKEFFKQNKQYSINPATCHDADDRAAEAENEAHFRINELDNEGKKEKTG